MSDGVHVGDTTPAMLIAVVNTTVLLAEHATSSWNQTVTEVVDVYAVSTAGIATPTMVKLGALSIHPQQVEVLYAEPPDGPSAVIRVVRLGTIVPPVRCQYGPPIDPADPPAAKPPDGPPVATPVTQMLTVRSSVYGPGRIPVVRGVRGAV